MARIKKDVAYYQEENMRTLSLSTLYRIRRAEKASEGHFSWYSWPSNIKKVLKTCISAKLEAKRNG